MKNLFLLAFTLIATSSAEAASPQTYNIAVRDPVAECASSIRKIVKAEGGQVINVLDIIGVVTADLSEDSLASVERLPCVLSVEENREVFPQPRVGRNN